MPASSMTFLFDSGQVFSESWNLTDHHSEPLLVRVTRVATARLPLLASCVRIVQLKAKGMSMERPNLRGTGGTFASPRDGFKLLADMRTEPTLHLRGVPKEVYQRDPYGHATLTAFGATALANYSKALSEAGAVIIRHGEPRPVKELHATGVMLYGWEKDRKATLRKLKTILREEEAIAFWQELKKKEAEQKTRYAVQASPVEAPLESVTAAAGISPAHHQSSVPPPNE